MYLSTTIYVCMKECSKYACIHTPHGNYVISLPRVTGRWLPRMQGGEVTSEWICCSRQGGGGRRGQGDCDPRMPQQHVGGLLHGLREGEVLSAGQEGEHISRGAASEAMEEAALAAALSDGHAGVVAVVVEATQTAKALATTCSKVGSNYQRILEFTETT